MKKSFFFGLLEKTTLHSLLATVMYKRNILILIKGLGYSVVFIRTECVIVFCREDI